MSGVLYTVKRIDRPGAWSGVHKYATANDGIRAEVNSQGQPVTGLTKEQARGLEAELFLEPGTLNPNSPYWHMYQVKISDIIFLDENIAEHKLAILFLKGQKKKVAQANDIKHAGPKARYLMYTTEAVEIEEAENLTSKTVAYTKLGELTEDRARAVYLIGNSNGNRHLNATSTAPQAIKNALGRLVEKDPAEFIKLASDADLSIKVNILDMVNYRVFERRGGAFFRTDTAETEDNVIGYTMDQAVDFFKSGKNNQVVAAFMSQLAEAKEGK